MQPGERERHEHIHTHVHISWMWMDHLDVQWMAESVTILSVLCSCNNYVDMTH